MVEFFKEHNGRDPTDVEKATIKFYLDGSEPTFPDFMGFNKRVDLIRFLKGESYEDIMFPKHVPE
jgi:hypothetical protein